MRKLLLLRHAKSGWKKRAVPDHDRPLKKRGKRDAPRMGRLLKERGLLPDLILSSTATRAQETAELVAESCGYEGDIQLKEALYFSGSGIYARVLRKTPDEYQTVLMVGHNPVLEDFVQALTGRYERLPTAALVSIEFDIDRWQDLEPGMEGKLVDVWRPKELD